MFWDVTDREQAQAELARAEADTEVAHRVQQKFFPAVRCPLVRAAAARGFDIGGASYPLEAVGGDYYDYFRLDEDRLAVAIGDVSGHGSGPALLMAIARAYLRASARADAMPGDVLERVNRLLANDVEGDRYITLLLAWLDMRTRSLVYASAGHATGFVLDAGGAVKHRLESTAVPLGIAALELFPTAGPIELESGDLVLLLTDGVTDSRDPDRVAFDEEHALNIVRFYRRSGARQIAVNLHHAARAFAQNHPQLDDSTAVIIKVLGQ
jgi:sigma-B regulation protein RsbU (phosphoserine phosphatase)